MPLPSIPWLVDLPPQAEIARQLRELRFVQVFEAGYAVRSKSILRLELPMPLAPHELAVLAPPVKRAIEYHYAAPGTQASARFGQRSVIVGGIMQRGVEYGQVELRA